MSHPYYVKRKDTYEIVAVFMKKFRHVTLVSSPHPTLKEWKGFCIFGQKAWSSWQGICASQSDYSFSTVIWLANRRNVKHHCSLYKFESPYWPIRLQLCLSTTMSACMPRAGQAKRMAQSHQTLFPRRGLGLRTTLTPHKHHVSYNFLIRWALSTTNAITLSL